MNAGQAIPSTRVPWSSKRPRAGGELIRLWPSLSPILGGGEGRGGSDKAGTAGGPTVYLNPLASFWIQRTGSEGRNGHRGLRNGDLALKQTRTFIASLVSRQSPPTPVLSIRPRITLLRALGNPRAGAVCFSAYTARHSVNDGIASRACACC